MKFKCVQCDNKGDVGTLDNIKQDSRFIAKQWYVDDTGLIHTMIICLNCGIFHDCKFSFIGMLFGRPYKAVGYMNKDDIRSTIEKSLFYRGIGWVDETSLLSVGINKPIFDYLSKIGVKYNICPDFFIDDIDSDIFSSKS